MRRAAFALVSCALVCAAAARAQSSVVGPIDPLPFSQLMPPGDETQDGVGPL